MKIVSLLPSATEIAYELGLGGQVVGVSSDCDYPPEVRDKPVISDSVLDVDEESSPGEVDAEVRSRVADSEPIYRLDRDLVRELRPDLILTRTRLERSSKESPRWRTPPTSPNEGSS